MRKRVGFADLERRPAPRHAELLHWLFGYWLLSLVTLIGSMIALARIVAP